MKFPTYAENGQLRGEIEIPDEVIKSAYLVSNYLGNNPNIASLCGLYIRIEKINVEVVV